MHMISMLIQGVVQGALTMLSSVICKDRLNLDWTASDGQFLATLNEVSHTPLVRALAAWVVPFFVMFFSMRITRAAFVPINATRETTMILQTHPPHAYGVVPRARVAQGCS
jgi:hypothetical protein